MSLLSSGGDAAEAAEATCRGSAGSRYVRWSGESDYKQVPRGWPISPRLRNLPYGVVANHAACIKPVRGRLPNHERPELIL